jgi:uncharacterized protein YceH (UPF0502 family)
LRGPQTPGELRGRSERLHRFETLEDVQSTLQRLMQREPALVRMLARQPGTKEARYRHLLSGAGDDDDAAYLAPAASESGSGDRVAHLEQEVASLQRAVADLQEQFAAFRKQFE